MVLNGEKEIIRSPLKHYSNKKCYNMKNGLGRNEG